MPSSSSGGGGGSGGDGGGGGVGGGGGQAGNSDENQQQNTVLQFDEILTRYLIWKHRLRFFWQIGCTPRAVLL